MRLSNTFIVISCPCLRPIWRCTRGLRAGMHTPARLANGMSARQAHALATTAAVATIPLDRYAIRRRDLNGLLLGFAAFAEPDIREGMIGAGTPWIRAV